jgi:hypothetical protein
MFVMSAPFEVKDFIATPRETVNGKGWRLEAGGWRLEVGGWRLEAGG